MTETPTAVRRVRYYDGQYLLVPEFEDEQAYHLEGQRRLSRGLRLTGILEGLAVRANDASSVKVGSGTAVDRHGRQLVLMTETTLSLGSAEPGTRLTVAIMYDDFPDVPATSDAAVESNTRFTELPILAVLGPDGAVLSSTGSDERTQAELEAKVVLASISVTADGVFSDYLVDTQHAGLSVPGNLRVGDPEPGNDLLRDATARIIGRWNANVAVSTEQAAARLQLSDAGSSGLPPGLALGTTTETPLSLSTAGKTRLTVSQSGTVGIGVPPADSHQLTVAGATSLNGTLTVGAETTVHGPLTVGGRTTVHGPVEVGGDTTVRGSLTAMGPVTMLGKPESVWEQSFPQGDDKNGATGTKFTAPTDGLLVGFVAYHNGNKKSQVTISAAWMNDAGTEILPEAYAAATSRWDDDGMGETVIYSSLTLPVAKGKTVNLTLDYRKARWFDIRFTWYPIGVAAT